MAFGVLAVRGRSSGGRVFLLSSLQGEGVVEILAYIRQPRGVHGEVQLPQVREECLSGRAHPKALHLARGWVAVCLSQSELLVHSWANTIFGTFSCFLRTTSNTYTGLRGIALCFEDWLLTIHLDCQSCRIFRELALFFGTSSCLMHTTSFFTIALGLSEVEEKKVFRRLANLPSRFFIDSIIRKESNHVTKTSTIVLSYCC